MLSVLASGLIAAASYMTLAALTRHEVVISKSRFIAIAAPVQSADEALEFVKEASDQKARHNCFAWRLRDGSMRTNGDGEPGGTAGPPILAAIDGASLQDVAVLVARYKLDGGAKLGTGGLVRAYGGTAEACLADAETVNCEPMCLMSVRYDPQDTGTVFQLLGQFSPGVVDDDAGDGAKLETSFEAPPEEAARLASELHSATQGRIEGLWKESNDDDFPFPEFVAGASL